MRATPPRAHVIREEFLKSGNLKLRNFLEKMFYKEYKKSPVRLTPTRAAKLIQQRWMSRNQIKTLQMRLYILAEKIMNKRNRLGHSLPNNDSLMKQYTNTLRKIANLRARHV